MGLRSMANIAPKSEISVADTDIHSGRYRMPEVLG